MKNMKKKIQAVYGRRNRRRAKKTQKAVCNQLGFLDVGFMGGEDGLGRKYSLEVKDRDVETGRNTQLKVLWKWLDQAERNSKGRIPLVVLHRTRGNHDDNILIIKAYYFRGDQFNGKEEVSKIVKGKGKDSSDELTFLNLMEEFTMPRGVKKEKEEEVKGKAPTKKGAGITAKNLDFSGHDATLEEVFGKKLISRGEMVQKISAYIKENDVVRK
jgi:hypothetical protein